MRVRTRAAWAAVRRLLLVAALVALVLGLGDRAASSGPEERQLDVVVAVDVTTSMSALDDPTGSRITAVRRDLAELVDLLPGARVALVTFGRENRVRLPLTPDHDAVAGELGGLQVEEPTAGTGSSVSDVVPAIRRQLARAAADGGGDRLPVVVLATDGEDTRPGRQRSFAPLAGAVGSVYVLGYGTRDGGVMPLEQVAVGTTPPEVDEAGPLVTDPRTGGAARSRLDPDHLERIAEQLGGTYTPADGTQDIAALADRIEAQARPDDEPAEPARELRWLWALLLLLLTLPELRLGWRQFLDARREVRA